MKISPPLITLMALFATAVLAQDKTPPSMSPPNPLTTTIKGTTPTATPAATPAPTSKTPTTAANSGAVQAVCKDGTTFNGDTLKGACRGHGGVDKKASRNDSATAAKTTDKPMDKTVDKPATNIAAAPISQAAGGGAGKVWSNESSKVYHCEGDKFYGKTKKGEYMSEADAKSKGFRPDHGKACTGK